LARSPRAVEVEKSAFALERRLKPGSPVAIADLVRSGYLRGAPLLSEGLEVDFGRVGQTVNFPRALVVSH
jgi:hypothetical protein